MGAHGIFLVACREHNDPWNIMHPYSKLCEFKRAKLCEFKRADTHKTRVYGCMCLANLSPNPCLMWLHYI